MRSHAALLAAAWLAFPIPMPAQSKGKAAPRHVYVNVVDRAGTPVTDLQPADFEIVENGMKREILRAALATSPMRIVVLADTGDAAAPALTHLRAALVTLSENIAPEHELALVSTGRQVRVRVAPTTDRKKF